jgi:pyruvate/2-oxoglutarate dehydrogenase complex dihydrolipoamide dehydrogenase (E3) component
MKAAQSNPPKSQTKHTDLPTGGHMTELSKFDAIIIGAGQAGGPLAGALAKAGRKVALIEREHVGGTCINEGCTPTKTMIASARVAHLARRAADYGVNTGPVSVTLERVRERKRAIVESFRNGSQNSLERIPGLELIFGEASFTGSHSLEVRLRDGGTRGLNAPQIFINVGTRPFVPELPGLNTIPALNSTSIMELEVAPEHLIVLGGGYIGFEFGQMFARFGSKVSIIERATRMLEREDPDISQAITQVMTDEGMGLYPGCTAQSVHQTADGRIELEVNGPDGAQTISGSHLLVAIGRTSNADTLHLEAAGIGTDARGFIPVNEHLETNIEGVFVLGDVKGGPAFTHISYDDYRIVRDRLLHGASRSTENRLVPYTMFTDPPLARIGLDETQARDSGREVLVFRLPMTRVARAIETDETRGMMKAVVDAQTGLLLGATVLGIEGGEVMSVLQMAMIGGVKYDQIREAVFAHPTLSESLNNLFMTSPKRIAP